MAWLQMAVVVMLGLAQLAGVLWAASRWIHKKWFRRLVIGSALAMAAMWVSMNLPLIHDPRGWDVALAAAILMPLYFLGMVLVFTMALFVPVVGLHAWLPRQLRFLAYVVGSVPAAIWSAAFYAYVIWFFAWGTLGLCLPPAYGHSERPLDRSCDPWPS